MQNVHRILHINVFSVKNQYFAQFNLLNSQKYKWDIKKRYIFRRWFYYGVCKYLLVVDFDFKKTKQNDLG